MLKKLLVYPVLLIIVFFVISKTASAADPANLKRFGIGWGYTTVDYDLYNPMVVDLGVGWYTDWAPHNTTPKIAADIAKKGIERLTLVLTRTPYKYYSEAGCTELKKYVKDNPEAFRPEMTYWSVGNELGYDPDNLTATKYASEFISWRDCIKSINQNYKVGSGSITSMWVVLPRTYPLSCADIDATNSGKTYFKTYINRIKSINSDKLPDFIMMHAYNTCYPPLPGENTEFSQFKNGVITYRKIMKELGLQNKELWIKEFNGSGYDKGFLEDSFEYLLNAKDKELGYPNDDYRLVQRFAWFMLKNTPDGINSTTHVLANSDGLTTLGQTYKNISRKYAGSRKVTNTPTPTKKPRASKTPTVTPSITPRLSPTKAPTFTPTRKPTASPTPTKKPSTTLSPTKSLTPTKKPSITSTPTINFPPGDGNKDGKVDGIDYLIWLNHYGTTTTRGSENGDYNTPPDGKVDGIDYVIWLGNYK